MSLIIALLQGAVEYGALASRGAGSARGLQSWPITAWISDHPLAIAAILAVVFLFWLLRPRRRY